MYNNKPRRFTLFVVVFTLTLIFPPTFGQTPVAPQTREALPITPLSTNTVAAAPSPIPPSEKEKDAVLQAVSDVAKAAIEANKVTMDTTATFYREKAEQDSRFFTYTTTLIGASIAVLAGIFSFFGIKGYQSLRNYIELLRKKLDDEVLKFTTSMEHTHAKAQKTLQAKMKNDEAEVSINISISNIPPSEKEDYYAKALISLEESLKISGEVDPVTRAHTYAMRAYIRRRQDDYPRALSDITEALNRVQDNASYYFNAACYNNLNGDKVKARSLLERACALNPIYRAGSDPDLVGL
jgi:tetratricopeptide (TPR) repeat protein